jgi:hypothetical protein
MKTFIYDINNQKRVGRIRDGWCKNFTGGTCTMRTGFVELEMVRMDFPQYNDKTQTADLHEYADVPNKKWITEWIVRDLTPQEIEERKPKWNKCTPRQFRLALLTKNPDPNYVDNLINGIENEQERIRAKIEWEYAIEILKNHNYVQQLAASLNMNSDELNDLFGYANTL